MIILDVLIVGAGIGGLQTALALAKDGHKVTVLESVDAFLEVGAGIRVPPNSSRLSQSWGVDFSKVKKEVSLGNRFVDWQGKVLLDCPFSDVETRYGAPYYFIHRADLLNLLLDTARAQPSITILTKTKVVSYDFEQPSVTTSFGQTHTADLIICADGIKSAVRDTINGHPCTPVDTGDVAYRILVPTAPLLHDSETAHLVAQPWATHWIGPEAHAVGYPLRGGELYNIIIDVTHATDLGEAIEGEEWRSAAGSEELVERFKEWCPMVRKLVGLTGRYLKWKLADFPEPLRRWVHTSGKVALLGDACHPMMPYMAQGAAMATEDAACLAAALRRFEGKGEIGEALRLYERQRRPRAGYVARNTRVLQEWLHLYNGPERDKKDEMMKVDGWENPVFWGWRRRTDWLFGHDASKISIDETNNHPQRGHECNGEKREVWATTTGDSSENEGIPPSPPFPRKKASVYLPGGAGIWQKNRKWEPTPRQIEAYHKWRNEST